MNFHKGYFPTIGPGPGSLAWVMGWKFCAHFRENLRNSAHSLQKLACKFDLDFKKYYDTKTFCFSQINEIYLKKFDLTNFPLSRKRNVGRFE